MNVLDLVAILNACKCHKRGMEIIDEWKLSMPCLKNEDTMVGFNSCPQTTFRLWVNGMENEFRKRKDVKHLNMRAFDTPK